LTIFPEEDSMIEVTPAGVEEYAARHTTPLSPLHAALWKETYERTTTPQMMVGPLEGAFLRFLVRLTQARRILEVGMFTGYSALAFAEALPEDGRMICCDINPKTSEIARRYFSESPDGRKIEIRLGPAAETLKTLSGPFDLCFIDADKEGYGEYYEACMGLVRKGGLILLDNMLRRGKVLAPDDPGSSVIHSLNQRIQNDPRVENVLLPIRDGIMLVAKL
jgi:caffeoyl-CoA O-methyltransferase